MKISSALLAVCSLLILEPVAAAEDYTATVQKVATARVSNAAIPGLVVVTVNGQEQKIQGFGLVTNGAGGTSGKAQPHLPDASTVFEIGSVSKTFTALLLADMQMRGELKLDDAVASLLPAYSIPHYQGRAITLLDLATQTSALPRLPANLMPKRPDNPYADYTESNLRDFLHRYQLTRTPGAKYEYSNLGFGLLSQALSARAGKSYAELVQERIAKPLGMADTGIALTASMQANLATGHDAQGKTVANWDMPTLAGAGALRSSAQDMLRYLQAHMHSANVKVPAGLQLVQQAQRPTGTPGLQIGLAWHVQSVRGQTVVLHNGMTGGYASFIGFTADGQRGVVVLANAAVNVDDIGMAALLPAMPAADTSNVNEKKLSAQQLQEYTGRYQLAPGAILSISAGPDGLLAQLSGQERAAIFPRKKDEFFYKIVEASLQFERDASGKIQSLTLHQNGHASPAHRIGELATEAAKRAEITLPAEQLKQYVGSYTLAPGFKLIISEQSGQLYAQATGQGSNPIYAEAADKFFLKDVDAQLSFQRQANGKISGLVLHQSGRNMPGPRDGD
ncbi:serine hydrolase [Undibacterium umbellatum]|uniref:Beta-lactamase n=1 Tax=Undibacterium umbellatum TaxID=2762300 RepID=A0ABR6ZFS5_9BURK|nr:serine hydrolase [Undibacterium umbellatum]MBC3910524.1 serine hydrolase [Undibacterium umbellatum]